MEGIFFSRRTIGSFFFPHATEGVAYITSAQDNTNLYRHVRTMFRAIFDRTTMKFSRPQQRFKPLAA